MTTKPQQQALAALGRANAAKLAAPAAVEKAVVTAKRSGATWQQIADVLGRHQSHTVRSYRSAVAKHPPTPKKSVAAALAAIETALAAQEAAVSAVTPAVAVARQEAVTWEDIATKLGTTQPWAVAKYGKLIEVTTTVRPV